MRELECDRSQNPRATCSTIVRTHRAVPRSTCSTSTLNRDDRRTQKGCRFMLAQTIDFTITQAPAAGPSATQLVVALGAILSPLVVLAGVIWTNVNTGRQIKLSVDNVTKQISAANEVAEKARAASAAVAQSQIDAASENARRQASASVVSAGRLRWIDAIREDVAEFLSLSRSYHYVFQEKPSSKDKVEERRRKMAVLEEKMMTLLYRVELRLTKGKEKHDQLLNDMRRVPQSNSELVDYNLHEAVVVSARDLFYTEWKRLRAEVGSEAAGPQLGAPVAPE